MRLLPTKNRAKGYFITGTDTGVGKTRVSCALLHAFAINNNKVIGMKPVAAGCENGRWEDVELLMTASTVSAPYQAVNPYALTPPLAPHIAAKQTKIEIDLRIIHNAFLKLQQISEIVIIEGVGGFSVPLNNKDNSADLARILAVPVILVVGLRLGCLNHALLTAQAVKANGLHLAGWVANNIDPQMLAQKENIQALEQRMDCPLLGIIPFLEDIDPKKISRFLDLSKLS